MASSCTPRRFAGGGTGWVQRTNTLLQAGTANRTTTNRRTVFRVDMIVGVTHHYSGVIGEHTLLYRSSLGSLDQRELSFAFAFSAASRICGPLEAASTCPSGEIQDRKSTRLNSSHRCISY